MTATMRPDHGPAARLVRPAAIAALLLVAGCASTQSLPRKPIASGYGGQSTADATCIREHREFHEPFFETVRGCGAKIPDLTNDPDLQRLAAVSGQPYVATALGQDGKDHWYLCRVTGLHPGDLPTRTSPFRCSWLHVASPHRPDLDSSAPA